MPRVTIQQGVDQKSGGFYRYKTVSKCCISVSPAPLDFAQLPHTPSRCIWAGGQCTRDTGGCTGQAFEKVVLNCCRCAASLAGKARPERMSPRGRKGKKQGSLKQSTSAQGGRSRLRVLHEVKKHRMGHIRASSNTCNSQTLTAHSAIPAPALFH